MGRAGNMQARSALSARSAGGLSAAKAYRCRRRDGIMASPDSTKGLLSSMGSAGHPFPFETRGATVVLLPKFNQLVRARM